MKLNILAIASHPDDAELCCSGTLLTHKTMGYKTGILDLTRGELGTRGTPEIRDREADKAATVLKLDVRKNLAFADGFFKNDEAHQLELIKMIRLWQPDIVMCNAVYDRHPDHGRAGALAREACFYAGLRKIETQYNGEQQKAWRPAHVYHYIQDRYMKPDIITDISDQWHNKLKAIKAFKSQFYDPDSQEPQTYISHPDFLNYTEARAREMGRAIGVQYGEGFVADKQLGIKDLLRLS